MKKLPQIFTLLILVSSASATVTDKNFNELPTAWETDQNLQFSMTSTGSGLDKILFQSREPSEPGFTDIRTKSCNDYSSCDWSLRHSESDSRTYEYRFRIRTTTSPPENTRYQQVTYYNDLDYGVDWTNEPPETASRGSEVEMSVTAEDSADRFDTEGELKLQYRNDDGDWETFDSRTCSSTGTSETCSNSGSTDLTSSKLDDGSAYFRGLVVFKGNVKASTSTAVTSLPGERGNIDDVDIINNLPDEAEDGSSFEIKAEAEGENLQDLYIQERDIGEEGWTDWKSKDCGSRNDCELYRDYTVSGTGEKEFRAYVEATGTSDNSDLQTLDFISSSSERIDNVRLDELPDDYNVDDDLEVTGDADGENLDEIVLKTKQRYESWSNVHTESCSGSSCSFDYDFNPSRTGDLEFKLVAEAGGDTKDSNIEVVDFFEEDEPEVDSVDLDNLPSEQEINQDMSVDGETRGNDLDSLIFQKRDPSDGWEDVETQSCSGTSCEFDSVYQQSDKEEVDFRLKAEAGGDSRNSNSETVDFVEEETEEENDQVDDVHINNLPSEVEDGSSFVIDVDASGENLEDIYIQQRDTGTESWNNWRSSSCSGDTCSLRETYSVSSTGQKEFRGFAETDDDSDSSDIETVDFISGTIYSVNDVTFDELPSRWNFEEDLEISGEAEGSNLDNIAMKTKRRFGSWSEVTSDSCSSSTCSLEHTFDSSRTGDLEFKITATAGGITSDSNIEVVEFYEEAEFNVDSVTINDLPSEQPVRETFEIIGQSTGENLEDITVQKKLEGSNWQNVESRSCSGGYCQISDFYSQSREGNVSFRIRAESGSSTGYSSTENVNFTTSDDLGVVENRIRYVNIDEVRDRQETGKNVTLSGSMRGSGLDTLEIQKGGRFESWSKIGTSECAGSPCTITGNYSQDNTGNVEFRLKGYAGELTETSGIEVVEYYNVPEDDDEEGTEDEDPFVSSVNLDELDDRHPVNNDIELSADASGREIDSIKLQEKRRYESWDTIEEDECGGVSSCSIEADFETGVSGDVEFRAKGEAGDHSRASNIEVVEFYGGDRRDDDDDEGDANLEVEVEDEENNNLDDARVHVQNGESVSRYTDYRGEVDFDLDSDEYTVTASKAGYETEDDEIDIEDGENQRIEFRLERLEDFAVTVSYNDDEDNNVCIGNDFTVTGEITNYEGIDQEYTISGTGLGGADSLNIEVDDQDSEEFELVFENVENRDNGRFTVEVEGDDETKSIERQVDLNNCGGDDVRDVPSGLSAEIVPREVLTGEVVRIKGDVQGVNSPVDVTASNEGFSKTVSSTDSGGYTIFHTPETPGVKKFTISSGGLSTERTLEVLPTASVSSLDAPRKVVQGQNFELCADVSSGAEPEVILFRDGQRLDSKVSSGRVCFETRAGSEGEKNYWVRAATSGQTGSASKKVEVIEEGEEFDTFPGQVAVEKTEPAQAKMTLYNKDPGVKHYQISVDNFRDTWVSVTDKEVVLPQGESKEVYFYFSPEEAGSFTPVLKAETSEEVFERDISTTSQDISESDGVKSWFSSLF